MRVVVLDLCGFALGAAVGLRELGCHVEYIPAEPLPGAVPSRLDELRVELLTTVFGKAVGEPDPGADLTILCDAYADQLWAAERGIQTDAPMDPRRPLAASINPRIYPARLAAQLALVHRARRLAILDGSDRPGPREEALLRIPGARLLAREVPLAEAAGPWEPFPFIYNSVLLLLEKARPRENWFVPFEARPCLWEWVFCGTLDHPRYGGRRARLLAEVEERWPAARRRVVQGNAPFVQVLEVLQSTLWGLDLPGGGELCFRLHELLALGVPILRPWPWEVVVPGPVADLCRPAPDPARRPSGGQVLEVYRSAYAPAAAARHLLRPGVRTCGRDRSGPGESPRTQV